MKKFLSAVLAAVMIFALAVPALADDPSGTATKEKNDETQGATITLDSGMAAPALSITYDTTEATFVLNPYKKTVSSSTDQVIGVEGKVTNASEVPVLGSITAKATTEGGINLLGALVNANSINKEAFLFIDVYGAKDKTSEGSAYEETEFDGTAFTVADNRIVLTNRDNVKTDLYYLDATGGDNADMNYKIKGNTASKCSTWDADADKVSVQIVFSWKRTALPEAS